VAPVLAPVIFLPTLFIIDISDYASKKLAPVLAPVEVILISKKRVLKTNSATFVQTNFMETKNFYTEKEIEELTKKQLPNSPLYKIGNEIKIRYNHLFEVRAFAKVDKAQDFQIAGRYATWRISQNHQWIFVSL
jgi:hypothetical protein